MDILKIELLTPDLDKTKQFYLNKMELAIIEKTNNSVSFQAGGTQLTFIYAPNVQPVYHLAFNIPHNKLDEALAWMAARLEIIDTAPGSKIADFVNWNAKSFYFFDETGNILELIARYDLDNEIQTLFDGSSILSVSELGLAADDVSMLCNNLKEEYDLSLFSKQPQLPNFAALGDNNGLLIISAVNRNWYLTSIPAKKYHTKIVLRNNNKIQPVAFYVNE